MIDAEPHRAATATHRQRDADDVVRVEQVERRCAQIELREHGCRHRKLDPVTGTRPCPASQSEHVANADRGEIAGTPRGAAARLLSQPRDERMRRLGVGDEWTEHIASRQWRVPGSLRVCDPGPAALGKRVLRRERTGGGNRAGDEQHDGRAAHHECHGQTRRGDARSSAHRLGTSGSRRARRERGDFEIQAQAWCRERTSASGARALSARFLRDAVESERPKTARSCRVGAEARA
jgi:hypothetical protein